MCPSTRHLIKLADLGPLQDILVDIKSQLDRINSIMKDRTVGPGERMALDLLDGLSDFA
jgi:hypothetical protein